MTLVKAFPPALKSDHPLELKVTFCVRGVLSPLLSNLVLDELDRELERAATDSFGMRMTAISTYAASGRGSG